MGNSNPPIKEWEEPTKLFLSDFWNHTWYPKGVLKINRVVINLSAKFTNDKIPMMRRYDVNHLVYDVWKNRETGEVHVGMAETAKNGQYDNSNIKVEILAQSKMGNYALLKISVADTQGNVAEYEHAFWHYNFFNL